TGSSLQSDSVAWYAGVGRFDMIGQKNLVHIRDTAITLDAVTAAYFLRQERLEAHKNVVAVNRNSGSVLRGPNLTYYRALKGVRDTLEMYATGRPTIDYRLTADTTHLPVDRKKPQHASVCGTEDAVRARAVSSNTTVRAESLALDVPDQVLTDVRGFGQPNSTMKRDSTGRRDSTPDWI